MDYYLAKPSRAFAQLLICAAISHNSRLSLLPCWLSPFSGLLLYIGWRRRAARAGGPCA